MTILIVSNAIVRALVPVDKALATVAKCSPVTTFN
jgi:hypothetical protein